MSDLVLYVDDEPENLTAFRYAFGTEMSVLTAQSGQEALEVMRDTDIAVLVVDQRMPDMTGVEVCTRARRIRPDAFRVIVTAYADAQVAIEAINRGEVNRFVLKPWRNEDLAAIIRSGIERLRIERAIRAIQVDLVGKAVGRLAVKSVSELVHEVALPLRTLEKHLQDLGDAMAGLDPSQKAAASRALHGATESATLANAFLRRMSREAHPSAEATPSCDATSVVAATVRIARAYADSVASLDVTVPRDALYVPIGPSSLSEIVLNLLLNAAEAIEEVEEADGEDAKIAVTLRGTDAGVVLRVQDNGPGLEPGALGSMFEPGFSTKGDDRGLGLAVVRSVVRAAGGDVRAHSERGTGCVVEVQLPGDSGAGRSVAS